MIVGLGRLSVMTFNTKSVSMVQSLRDGNKERKDAFGKEVREFLLEPTIFPFQDI